MAADELFEFGNAQLVLRRLAVVLEQRMQALQGGGLPMGKKLRFEIMFAAKLRLVGGAAEEFKNQVGLELGCKGPTLTTWHGNFSWQGPVFIMLLVQRQGRTTGVFYQRELLANRC